MTTPPPEDAGTLAGALAVEGLAFRRFRGAEDYPALLSVRESARERDGLDPLSARAPLLTYDDIARAFDNVAPGSPGRRRGRASGRRRIPRLLHASCTRQTPPPQNGMRRP